MLLAAAALGALLTALPQGGGLKGVVFRSTEAPPAASTSPAAAPYDVELSPAGVVRFARVPRRVVTQDANYNDMLYAVGQDEKLVATGSADSFYDGFYAQLPGVGSRVDRSRLTYLSGNSATLFDKELLYRLRADVHHIDPLQLAATRGWSAADVEEIARNVGPFFANRYSRENNFPGSHPYTYYTLWELADRIAQVYRRPEPVAALKRLYDALAHDIAARLPPEAQRPRVGLVFLGTGNRITPYSLLSGGFGQAHYALVGARDAFASIRSTAYGAGGGAGAALDLEGLLALDPDVLIVPFAIYPASAHGAATSRASYERLLKLKDDPLAQRLTALRQNRAYPGGTPLQGPVFFLFQIEMAAKQLYPAIFGPYRDDQRYPPAEQLFDRAAVAAALSTPSAPAQP